MRIVHVISSIDPESGGPPVALAGLTAAQARAGLAVSVVSTYRAGENLAAAETLKGQGVDVRLVGPTAAGALARHGQLAGALESAIGAAEVVHIHALWEEIQHQGARTAARRGKPYIIRPCGMLDPWSLRQSRWRKRAYMMWRLRGDLNGAAALHFTTEAERDLTGPLRLSAQAIVEPNGVDLGEFENLPARGTFRAGYPQIGGRPVALFLGRLHPKKGLELLIPAFAQCGSKEAVLVIAGPDSEGYQAKLEALAAERGVRERVIFTGMLKGAKRVEAFADADVFVLPSYQENFGIAVIEALAAGTPVIVSDQVNLEGEVRAGGVGAVVRMDVGELTRELGRWLGDEGVRREAASRARAFVWERYDWNRIARRWVERYLGFGG